MPVSQADVTAAILRYFGVVGHEDNGTSLGVKALEKYQDFEGSTCIQVTRRFVGKDYRRIVYQCSGYGYALHLSA